MGLRIAIATPTPHQHCETFVAAHIKGLDKVVLVLTDGSLPSCDGEGHPLLGSGIIDRAMGMILPDGRRARLRKRITALLKEHRIDVVLAEYGNTGAEMIESCRAADVPLVPYFLGFDAYRVEQLKKYANYDRLFAAADRIVAVSHAIEQHLIGIGAPAQKLVYNSCGADVDLFTPCEPATAPPHFLAVGRFVDKKAPYLTLLAFERIARLRPDARLTMVGGGDLWEACVQLVRAHKLQGRVDLVGPLDPAAIGALFRHTRAFVQHSLVTSFNDREGTPVAMLEAMAAGLPVISTRHGDIEELVAHGERGFLCAERDIEAMSAHMLQLIDDPALAGRMGAAAAMYARAGHRLADRLANLQRILQEVVDQREQRSA